VGTWTPDQLQRQERLFGKAPSRELEKVAFDFRYEFLCDHPTCSRHTLICTDWEMGESWRLWKEKYGEHEWEAKFREKYEREMIERFDTHFYVGTVHKHPAS